MKYALYVWEPKAEVPSIDDEPYAEADTVDELLEKTAEYWWFIVEKQTGEVVLGND